MDGEHYNIYVEVLTYIKVVRCIYSILISPRDACFSGYIVVFKFDNVTSENITLGISRMTGHARPEYALVLMITFRR